MGQTGSEMMSKRCFPNPAFPVDDACDDGRYEGSRFHEPIDFKKSIQEWTISLVKCGEDRKTEKIGGSWSGVFLLCLVCFDLFGGGD